MILAELKKCKSDQSVDGNRGVRPLRPLCRSCLYWVGGPSKGTGELGAMKVHLGGLFVGIVTVGPWERGV